MTMTRRQHHLIRLLFQSPPRLSSITTIVVHHPIPAAQAQILVFLVVAATLAGVVQAVTSDMTSERQEKIRQYRLKQPRAELERKAMKARERANLWSQE